MSTETAPKRESSVPAVASLKVKIFADGADKAGIVEMAQRPYIRGFTTNPTLMRKAGIGDYRAFAREVLALIPGRPIWFEVFSDDFAEMERQAQEIASWGDAIYVKIPVTNTRGESAAPLVRRLAAKAIKLNVTALTHAQQVAEISDALENHAPSCISVFAGRVADTGRDPLPIMVAALKVMRRHSKQELIWASPRELLNIFQADQIGCHIITVTNDILKKISLVGKDLGEYSLETVAMFRRDAVEAGYSI